jgi:hypothetical protein
MKRAAIAFAALASLAMGLAAPNHADASTVSSQHLYASCIVRPVNGWHCMTPNFAWRVIPRRMADEEHVSRKSVMIATSDTGWIITPKGRGISS